MKTIVTVICLSTMFVTLAGQSGKTLNLNEKEVNDFLQLCPNFENSDSTIVYLEKRLNLNLNCLLENILVFGQQEILRLNDHEVKALEKRALDITYKYYCRQTPIKFIKEGGVSGGGEIRISKTKINEYVLHGIVLAKTDLQFESDRLENELIMKINKRTGELLEMNK